MKKLFALLMFVLSGCASIAHGPRENVFLDSNPTNATVLITGKKNAINAVTPATVSLKRNSSYTVQFSKEGYLPVTHQISQSMDGWTLGNFLFGGIIGIGVDAITGSMWQLSPSQIIANLSKEEPPQQTAAAQKQ